LWLVAMATVAGCTGALQSTSTAEPSASAVDESPAIATLIPTASIAPEPSATPEPTPSPSPTPSPVSLGRFPACPDRPFDTSAILGPAFSREAFEGDESDVIARTFVTQLAGIYAWTPGADPCAAFTVRGLASAVAVDANLRAVAEGSARIESELVYRLRSEGVYDLRLRPPSVPLNLAFDLPEGSRTTDPTSGSVEVSAFPQRVGLHVVFVFDGHRWRADEVGPITDSSDLVWATIPATPSPGPPCTGFRRDPAGATFDQRSGLSLMEGAERRIWCDEDGRGRRIHVPEQLVFFTRFPCDRGSIAVLTLGRPIGAALDPLVRWEYMRDPKGEARAMGWLRGNGRYDGDARLPRDARSTGWTNGNITIWTAPSEHDAAIYVKRGSVVERWPRAADSWGVTDCN
jgi:hypothetical protein